MYKGGKKGMSYYKKMNLATKTMLAMVLGAIAGFIIGENAVKIQFIGTVWPVSYTHLDVYKRQGLKRVILCCQGS